MAYNSPYYQPQPTWNQQLRYPYPVVQEQAVQIRGRPVSSIEEVRATTIDFDGSVFYFPDLANKKIYTKQINYDGTSTLNIYELKPMPVETKPVQIDTSNFVTHEELNGILQKFAAAQTQSELKQAPAPQEPPKPQPQTVAPPQNLKF